MLTKTQISSDFFDKRSDFISVLVILPNLLVINIPIILFILFPFSYWNIIPFFIFGILINSIINLTHECSHFHVFRTKEWNDRLGNWALGNLIFANFQSYRLRHWDHHRFLGETNDTKDSYLIRIEKYKLCVFFLRCLLGIEAVKKFFHQLNTGHNNSANTADSTWVVRLIIFQLLYFASIFILATLIWDNVNTALLVTVYTYFVCYIYSTMSIAIFIATLRAIAEHQITNNNITTQGRASLRNFNCSTISRIVFGSYGFGEHFTHHIYPAIPYYHLQHATQELAAKNHIFAPADDYTMVLYKLITMKSL